MTKNAPDDTDELQATAENPPTPDSHPSDDAPDDPTRLKRRDQFDSELGNNGNKHRTDGGGLLPDDSDTDNDGRTGVLSTYVEWHALVIGLALGTIAVQTGDLTIIAAIIGAGAAGSRAQLGLPDKYIDQAKQELPYFIAGTILGFLAVQFGVELPLLNVV